MFVLWDQASSLNASTSWELAIRDDPLSCPFSLHQSESPASQPRRGRSSTSSLHLTSETRIPNLPNLTGHSSGIRGPPPCCSGLRPQAATGRPRRTVGGGRQGMGAGPAARQPACAAPRPGARGIEVEAAAVRPVRGHAAAARPVCFVLLRRGGRRQRTAWA